jgi:hypothetical protein
LKKSREVYKHLNEYRPKSLTFEIKLSNKYDLIFNRDYVCVRVSDFGRSPGLTSFIHEWEMIKFIQRKPHLFKDLDKQLLRARLLAT